MDKDAMWAPVVWIAGVAWDDVPGTDKRMVIELANRYPILWIDSPRRSVWAGWWTLRYPAVEPVHPGITRLRTPGPVGFSRWPVRYLTAFLQRRTIVRNLAGRQPRAVVIADPVARFPRGIRAPRVLYVTDDWVAGASLMGYQEKFLRDSLKSNIKAAHAVAGVTPGIIELLKDHGLFAQTPARVIPNGAPVVASSPRQKQRPPVAGVVGQLNERLDLEVLEGVLAAGVRLRLIGPRRKGSLEFERRLDLLLGFPGAEWTGALDQDELAAQMAELSVGLTPYTDTAFNRSSFPLKTLEYLAAGLPVVSTNLSASRWIDSIHVTVTASPAAFVAAVVAATEAEDGVDAAADRVALAQKHGWSNRADDFDQLIVEARHGYRQR